MKYEDKVITFSVRDYYEETAKNKKHAGAIVNALMGVKMSEDDFLDKVHLDSIKETEETINRFIKYAKEANEDYNTINKINGLLDKLQSNLRLIQYIYITKDLSVSNRTWLCGNGYFKKIYQLSDIQIPQLNYYGYEHEEVWKDKYENGYLYLYEEDRDDIKISLAENFDDGVDYTKSYMDVISQVLAKNKVEATQDFVGWVDMGSKDGKVDAELDLDVVLDLFLMQNGQKKLDSWDSKYEIDIAELNKIVEQIQA